MNTATASGNVTAGQVVDASTGLPIPNAHVYVDASTGTTTDRSGMYAFPFDEGAVVTVSHVGYHPEQFVVERMDDGSAWVHQLEQSTVQLDEFDVRPVKADLSGLLKVGAALAGLYFLRRLLR